MVGTSDFGVVCDEEGRKVVEKKDTKNNERWIVARSEEVRRLLGLGCLAGWQLTV